MVESGEVSLWQANRDAEGSSDHISYSILNQGTDCIDLYQLHNISTAAELEKVLAPGGAMAAVAGHVPVYVGLGGNHTDRVVKKNKSMESVPDNFLFGYIGSNPYTFPSRAWERGKTFRQD